MNDDEPRSMLLVEVDPNSLDLIGGSSHRTRGCSILIRDLLYIKFLIAINPSFYLQHLSLQLNAVINQRVLINLAIPFGCRGPAFRHHWQPCLGQVRHEDTSERCQGGAGEQWWFNQMLPISKSVANARTHIWTCQLYYFSHTVAKNQHINNSFF